MNQYESCRLHLAVRIANSHPIRWIKGWLLKWGKS